VQAIVDSVAEQALRGDHVVVMSNGGFENIHQRLLDRLSTIIV
jgi:UDP-N-acetylmuramate: L-alanyl-gamma-D-glutamyl-meso-diaminopimelate ligase